MGRTGIAGTVGSWRVPRAARGSLGRSQRSVASGSAGINLGLVRTAQRVQVSVFRSVRPACPHVCTCERTGPGCASRALPVQQGCTASVCRAVSPHSTGATRAMSQSGGPRVPHPSRCARARWSSVASPDGAPRWSSSQRACASKRCRTTVHLPCQKQRGEGRERKSLPGVDVGTCT